MHTKFQTGEAMEPLAVSVNQLARLTGFGRSSLWVEIKEGRLLLRHKGRRAYILVEDAKAWLRGEAPTSGVAA